MGTAGPAFNAIAAQYDKLWTNAAAGRLQRNAVWQRIDPLFGPGDRILDLGCGTGEDALHFMRAGVEVCGVDASPKMARIARSRGVDARALAIEDIGTIDASFDGAISNFGPLNCVSNLAELRGPLAGLIRPEGRLALCVMGRFCFWETLWFLARAQPVKAVRRWSAEGAPSSLGVRVRYPSVGQLKQAFSPDFTLLSWCGVGVTVPPSCVTGLPQGVLKWLARFDSQVAGRRLWRALADHRLVIFERR